METTTIVEVALPNGATALVRARELAGGERAVRGERDVRGDALSRFDFDEVGKALEGLSEAIRGALAKAAPDSVKVELGLELAVKAGKLTGLIVEGEGKGSLSVTLEWNGGGGG